MWLRKGDKGFISGGGDGKVIVWDSAFTKANVIDVSTFREFPIMNPRIRAVCESDDGSKIAIGTRSSNIIEVDTKGGRKCVLNGHFDGELWGLAPVPKTDDVITAGEDFMVARWNLREKRLLKIKKIPYQARVVDVSSDGRLVAIGCLNGHTLILNAHDLSDAFKITDRKQEISEVKFSPDVRLLAIGSKDSRIRIYSTNGFKQYKECKGHHSRVLHIDWSIGSDVIMSNCTSYEILFFKADGTRNPSGASAYRNEKWNSWTCTLGWPVQGIFPAFADGSDINSCVRSSDRTVLATGDDFGKVNLFKYPVVVQKAQCNQYRAHSSHVTTVRFSSKEDYLVSSGGNDKAVIQWKFKTNQGGDDEEGDGAAVDESGYDPNEFDPQQREAGGLRDAEMPDNLKLPLKGPEIDLSGGGFEMEDMGPGEQFMAVKAFTGDVKNSVPTGFKEPPRCNDPPEGNLKLRHAFGFRCHDAKDTAKFLGSPDKVVFITAALGVKMDTNTFQQSFFNLHDEDLVSMDVTADKRFCATGSMPAKGRSKLLDIYVWDTQTMEKKVHLTGFHKGAVKHLKFNPSGKHLLSVGLDDDNSFAVYDWQNSKMLASSKVDRSPVFDCDWNDDTSFATITKDSIKFWTLQRGGCSAVKGNWGKDAKVVLASCKYVKGVCYTGSWNGTIISWSGGSKGKATPAHGKSAVFCLHYDSKQDLLLSGGKDGRVVCWKASSGNLTQTKVLVDPSSEGHQLNGGIRSIDSHPSGHYLIGTRQAELFTVAPDGTNQVFMMGHFDGELWALACHPAGTLFVTAGDDTAIHTYNLETLAIEDLYYHTTKIRAIDWSSNGEMIVAADYDGKIVLLSPKVDLLDEMQSGFGKGQWIEEIKFSPNNTMVAFGSHMAVSKLEIMYISNGKLQKGTQFSVGLTSALLHLDWSENSDFVVINSQAYELRWANIATKKNISASAAKDVNWATWTCKIGFPVQGIFPGVDGTDVNTVCRAANRQVMATGDDFQKVNLFRYPSVKPKSGCKKYTAHSSHVTRVRFMLGDNVLVSTGGNDKTILVWETDFGKKDHPGASQFLEIARGGQGSAPEEDYEEEDPNEIMGIPILPPLGEDEVGDQSMPVRRKQQVQAEQENLNGFEVEEVGEGDQFMAVLPWLGAIKPPSNWTDPPAQYDRAPKVKYTLDYVYGYRARDKRNNVFFLNNGDIAYYAAAVGIIHTASTNTQRHLIKHNDDIISMAVHPDRVTIATGELGPKPQVIIWNSLTGEAIATIKTGLIKGVDNLAYSESGKYLAATCMDPEHRVVVFDASNSYSPVANEKGGQESILALAWTSDTNFATGGIKNYTHWTLSGSSLKGSKGSIERSTSIVCMAKCDNTVLAGTATGSYMVFSGTSASKTIPLHKGFLDTISVGKSAILTGGKDAKINILSFSHEVVSTIEISAVIPTSFDPHVRAIALNEATGKLALGLYSSEVYECSTTPLGAGCKITNVKLVNQGHFAKNLKWNNEVWGLAVVDDDTFLTCSDDGTLRKWSASRRACIASKNLNVDNSGVVMGSDPKTNDLRDCSKLRSIAVHPSGLIAIGTADGSIRMAAQKDSGFTSLGIFRHQTRWVQELKFSPDGKKLAIGSHDAFINIYKVEKNLKLQYKIKKHSSAVKHIDWSLDSKYIHSNCQAYELLFFDSDSGKQVTGGATMLRDEDWATWTAVLGWPVKGIWRTEYKGSDIDAVDRSTKTFDTGYRILATAEDCSLIRLYRYPCLKKNSDSVDLRGHSSHVTNVRFNPSCSFIFSTGGEDQTVMQWKLTK